MTAGDIESRCDEAIGNFGPAAFVCFTQQTGVRCLGPGSPTGAKECTVPGGTVNSYRAAEVKRWAKAQRAA